MATSAPPGRTRLIHSLDTPFSTVAWPEISPDDQDTILELLCNLLSPLGQYTRTHKKPSRGKRAANRAKKDTIREPAETAPTPTRPQPPPLMPTISPYVDVGFNKITRKVTAPNAGLPAGSKLSTTTPPYSMIFVARGSQSAAFSSHYPRMIAAETRRLHSDCHTRLIGFSKPCSDRLASCLGVVNVSSIAIHRSAPGAEALWKFVDEHVPPVDAAWLEPPKGPQYNPTKIISTETVVGAKKTTNGSIVQSLPTAQQER